VIPVVAAKPVVIVIVIAKESVDKAIIIVVVIVVIIFLDETDDLVIEVVAVHVFVFVNFDKSDIHIFVFFVVEDREDVKIAIIIEIIEGQGGTSPHDQSHHRHHSGYREQQNNALHAKRHLLNREGRELPRPVS